MNYTPLEKQVILELHELEKKSGGIILPDGAGEKRYYGTVLFMGAEAGESILEVGDNVLYNLYGAREIEKDKIVMVGISDILCIIEED